MKALPGLAVFFVATVAYVTILDNFFISDDFVMLSFLRILEREPRYLFEVPSEIFRATSYIYFMLCYKVFGLNPSPYYALGILLHVIVSLMVYVLATRIAGDRRAGWAAALFFAAYERHQEAVMWISAANDAIVTLHCLLCLICWERYLNAKSRNGIYYVSALVVMVVALFSKEAAVVLLPSMALMQAMQRERMGSVWSARAWLRLLPFVLVIVAYLAFWLSLRQDNFFIAFGFYDFGPHFFPVYGRSLARLLVQALLFLVPFLYFNKAGTVAGIPKSPTNRGFLFFAALLLLAIAPYCFLTYLNHIPSRNTYLPSAGLAGIVGILVARTYELTPKHSLKRAGVVLFFIAVITANVAYIRIKKEGQYVERAAPTRALIEALNQISGRVRAGRVVYVQGFPLQEVIGKALVEVFSPIPESKVVFLDRFSSGIPDGLTLRWNENTSIFEVAAE